jgi:hypothetical protein
MGRINPLVKDHCNPGHLLIDDPGITIPFSSFLSYKAGTFFNQGGENAAAYVGL